MQLCRQRRRGIRTSKKRKGGQMRKPASRDNPAARELKIMRVRNIDRVKAMREYSQSALLILERILILF